MYRKTTSHAHRCVSDAFLTCRSLPADARHAPVPPRAGLRSLRRSGTEHCVQPSERRQPTGGCVQRPDSPGRGEAHRLRIGPTRAGDYDLLPFPRRLCLSIRYRAAGTKPPSSRLAPRSEVEHVCTRAFCWRRGGFSPEWSMCNAVDSANGYVPSPRSCPRCVVRLVGQAGGFLDKLLSHANEHTDPMVVSRASVSVLPAWSVFCVWPRAFALVVCATIYGVHRLIGRLCRLEVVVTAGHIRWTVLAVMMRSESEGACDR